MWSPPPLISKNFLSSRRARFSNRKFLKDRIIPCANRCRLSSGMNQFTIDSEFGVFQADGNEMLLQRVKEIYTIAKLKDVSRMESGGHKPVLVVISGQMSPRL